MSKYEHAYDGAVHKRLDGEGDLIFAAQCLVCQRDEAREWAEKVRQSVYDCVAKCQEERGGGFGYASPVFPWESFKDNQTP